MQIEAHLKFDSRRAIRGFETCVAFGAGKSSAGCLICAEGPLKKQNRIAMSLTMCKAHGFFDEQ
jgi:hypothetical protein